MHIGMKRGGKRHKSSTHTCLPSHRQNAFEIGECVTSCIYIYIERESKGKDGPRFRSIMEEQRYM